MREANISLREQGRLARQSQAAMALSHLERRWVTGPTLRNILDISAPTLWRWRRTGGFPTAKSINGRLFFYWPDVQAWLDRQPFAA
jgi:predicted DNA-binding transcriptional regulator AlpA